TTIGAAALVARRGWVGEAEEPTGQCDVVGPVGVGEEAVVTDAMEPVGQHVDQEAADELVGVDRHQLVAGVELGPVILPFESHALAVEADESAVGNSANDGHLTCSTVRPLAGSGRSSSDSARVRSSQASQSDRSNTTICRFW